MLSVIFGITSALVFGAADFFGGLAAKRIPAVRVTALASSAGLLTLLIAYPLIGGRWSSEAVGLGALSGVAGGIAVSLLYACLAIGPMSILSPLTAVVSAIVPIVIGLATGDQLGTLGFIALGIALLAVVLVGFVPEQGAVRPSLLAIVMAIGSGLAIGTFLVLINLTPADSGLVSLIVNRAVNGTLLFTVVGIVAFVAWWRRRRAPASSSLGREAVGWRAGLWLAISCGALDAIANTGILFGLRLGELSITAVLMALYPAGTILLASVVLKERIAPVQYAGLVLAIAAVAMLAVA
jgi:drug/metabolite transporter (DMT)-like permease